MMMSSDDYTLFSLNELEFEIINLGLCSQSIRSIHSAILQKTVPPTCQESVSTSGSTSGLALPVSNYKKEKLTLFLVMKMKLLHSASIMV